MPTKILMFGWEFPPYNSGGLGIACLGLTKALSEDNVDVDFVLPEKIPLHYDHVKFYFADSSAVNHTIPFEQVFNSYNMVRDKKNSSESNKIYTQYSDIYEKVNNYTKNVANLLQNFDPDIIHAHDWLTIEASLFAKKFYKVPLVFHIHSTEVDRSGGIKNIDPKVYQREKKGMMEADEVVAVSQYTKDVITKYYSIPSHKISIIHNGIDYQEEKLAKKDQNIIANLSKLKTHNHKILLYVGRLSVQKGLEFLIEAFAQHTKHNKNTILVIAGSGPNEEELIELIATKGLTGKVLMAGFVRGEKLRSLYHIADALIMPSVSEPFGIVALEAATHDTPIIMSKTSGSAEVLPNAILVDFWDTNKLSKMMAKIIKGENQEHLAKNHKKLSKTTWRHSSSKLNQLYNRL